MTKQTPEQFCAEVVEAQDRALRLKAVADGLTAARDAINILDPSDLVPEADREHRTMLNVNIQDQWSWLHDHMGNYAQLAKDADKYARLMRRRLARRVRA